MDEFDLKHHISWEISRHVERGYNNFTAWFILLTSLYLIPRSILFAYVLISDVNRDLLYIVGTYIVHILSYLLINSFCFILYYYCIPIVESCKINPDPWPWQQNKEGFKESIKKVFNQLLFNQIITIPVSSFLAGFDTKFIISSELPSFSEVFIQISIFTWVYEVAFYFTHRAFHSPWLYRKFHKRHHEFNVTISVAAEYAHPIEYFFGNSVPFGLGPLLYGQSKVHIITWFTWVAFGTISTAIAHSGYDFPCSPFNLIPFSPHSSYHDFHHYKNIENYGGLTVVVDSIFSTNFAFWRSLKNKKNEN